jgi:hypothetical protein
MVLLQDGQTALTLCAGTTDTDEESALAVIKCLLPCYPSVDAKDWVLPLPCWFHCDALSRIVRARFRLVLPPERFDSAHGSFAPRPPEDRRAFG